MNLLDSKKNLANGKGFTLAELLTVVAVMGIMSAIAVPNFLALQPQMRLNGATREVFSRLNAARARAVEENTTYKVVVPNNQTVTTWLDSDGDGVVDVGEASDAADIQISYSDVTITVSDGAPLQFNSRGTTNGARTYTLTGGGGATRTVTVNVTGNVKIN